MRFAGFLHVQTHFWNANILNLQFTSSERDQILSELFLWAIAFILRYLLEWRGKRELRVRGGEIGQSLITGRSGFPYFICIISIISI